MAFWKNIFKQEKSIPKHIDALAWLGWDMHNHLLPGIDDGSPDLETSILLIKGLKELGIHRSISTPHVMQGVHNNTPETIRAAYDLLCHRLQQEEIDFDLKFSAEYMIDEDLDNWIQKDQLCLLPNKHMLIEMSYLSESKALFQVIKKIQDKGYQPILAHPERYNYYHMNFKIYQEIKMAGCMLQLNLLSISRYYGEHVKSAAIMLIKEGLYDLLGTDMHHEKHLAAIRQVVTKYDVKDLLGCCAIKNASLFDTSHKMAI